MIGSGHVYRRGYVAMIHLPSKTAYELCVSAVRMRRSNYIILVSKVDYDIVPYT